MNSGSSRAGNGTAATLRAVIGGIELSAALAEREKIRDEVQVRMDEVTARWGVKVSQVEINEIDPPPGVKHSPAIRPFG